jgi:hypothetical protein
MSSVKTTVEISDALFQQAKAAAAEQGVSFRELVECGLRHVLKEARPKKKFRLRDCSFRGDGLTSGTSWEGILDKAYEDRSG